jgi:hypothetical protein
MNLGNVARVIAVSAACLAAVGSATSTSNNTQASIQNENSPPPAQAMEPMRALGLWRSTFGAVKIEADDAKGGLQSGSVQGVWVYQRAGQEVVGYFHGSLRGNVLQFQWQEPNNPPLTGEGFLVFEATGRQYTGRWWSDHRDRVGDWNGWRQGGQQGGGQGGLEPGQQQLDPYGQPYGGQAYGEQGYSQPPPPQPRYPKYPQQPPQPPPTPRTYY